MSCVLGVHSFVLAKQYSVVWIYHSLFTHSSVGGHVGCFKFGLLLKLL